MTESYSLMAVCCMIQLVKISFASYGLIVHTISCFIAFAVLIIYPVLIWWTLYRNWNQIGSEVLFSRFKTLFEDLKMNIGSITLIHPLSFLFRRFLMAIIVVIFRDYLFFQIFIKSMSLIAIVIILGEIPYETVQKTRAELLNEIIIMFVLYNLICFSPFIEDY